MTRRIARAAGYLLAASTLLVSSAAAFAAPPGDPPAPARTARNWAECGLERIDRQLVHCDALTGAGVKAPLSVPVQYPRPVVTELAIFAASRCTAGCGSGSTIGPDRALYVTDSKAGRVLRIDPRTGAQTTYARGLPIDTFGTGGAMDVAFIGHTAYVLVTLVHLPASPKTGKLLRLNVSGSFTPIVEGLDRPTSVELIGDTALVVTLTGKVIRIDGISHRG